MDTTRAGVSRRRMLQVGSAGVVAVMVGRPGRAWAGTGPAWLRRAGWAPLVGRPVALRTSGQRLALVAVRDLRGRSPAGVALAGRDDAFALVFAHDPAAPVAQGVYGLVSELGTFHALVVPEWPGRCAVVVNRTP